MRAAGARSALAPHHCAAMKLRSGTGTVPVPPAGPEFQAPHQSALASTPRPRLSTTSTLPGPLAVGLMRKFVRPPLIVAEGLMARLPLVTLRPLLLTVLPTARLVAASVVQRSSVLSCHVVPFQYSARTGTSRGRASEP